MKNSIFDITEQNNDLSSKIVAGLERISEAFRVLLWDYAKITGLSPIQIQILIFIHCHNDNLSNVSHLAKEFNVTKPTISDAVKALELKKLIKKMPSSNDKRAYTILLTDQGKKMVKATEQFVNPFKEILEQFSSNEQKQLFNHIVKIIFTLNRKKVLTVQRMCYNCRFYEKNQKSHFCKLMDIKLQDEDLRLDCPEYEGKPANNIGYDNNISCG